MTEGGAAKPRNLEARSSPLAAAPRRGTLFSPLSLDGRGAGGEGEATEAAMRDAFP